MWPNDVVSLITLDLLRQAREIETIVNKTVNKATLAVQFLYRHTLYRALDRSPETLASDRSDVVCPLDGQQLNK